MKNVLIVFFLLLSLTAFTQVKKEEAKDEKTVNGVPKKAPKAAFNQYRIITLEKDTTYVDTSLSIKKEYEYNYLRKDILVYSLLMKGKPMQS